MKKTLKLSFGRRPFENPNILSLICRVKSEVIHIPNLSYLACLIKKFYEEDLKIQFWKMTLRKAKKFSPECV